MSSYAPFGAGSGGVITLWMRLRNAREVVAGLRQTAAATSLLGNATDRLALKMERAGRRTFLMNQALFTLRRYSYMATLALTAGIAIVAKWGFNYRSQVQEAEVAFHKFGLTSAQVNNEIARLYRIAAISPFLFTDITAAARRFLAFGMDLHTTNLLVTNLTDALTALGVANTASLNRASLALAHMYSLGRVTGQVVYQLARDNVPIIQALEKELHLTGDQLRRVGTLGIPANVAIAALNKYISETPRFHNAALIFATKTWRGIVTTTRDYMAQFLGTVEGPLFFRMQRTARRFLLWISSEQVNRLSRRGDILGIAGLVSPGLAKVLGMLFTMLHAIWNLLVNGLIPAFRIVATVMLPMIIYALKPTIALLAFLGHHTLLAKLFFALLAIELGAVALRFAVLLPLQSALIFRMIVWNTVQRIALALGLARLVVEKDNQKTIIFSTILYTKFGRVIRAVILFRRAEIGLMLGQILYTTRLGAALQLMWRGYAVGNFAKASYGFRTLEGRILRTRIAMFRLTAAVKAYSLALLSAARSMVVFLLTDPVGWAILLVAALAILYWRWKRFRDLVNETVLWIYRHPLISVILPVIGPLLAVARLLTHIRDLVRSIWGITSHPWRMFGVGGGFHLPHGFGGWARSLGRGFGIPGLASGGTIRTGGLAMVGEQGPEMLALPSGATVSPIGRAGAGLRADLSGLVIELHNRTTLEADGRQLAEVVSKHRLDAQARL